MKFWPTADLLTQNLSFHKTPMQSECKLEKHCLWLGPRGLLQAAQGAGVSREQQTKV